MPPEKGQNTQDELWKRLLSSLKLADRLGWLNAPIVANALSPHAPARLKYAERLLAHLVKRGWFTPHKMPFRQRSCYTATKEGRRQWLLSTDPSETGAFDPSEMQVRRPGAATTYQHDTRAAAALLWLANGDMDRIIFDREIVAPSAKNDLRKRPDGIFLAAQIPGKIRKGTWIEVENTRKTGPNMRKQVTEMIDITGQGGNGGLWVATRVGHTVAPNPTVILVVPEGYNSHTFRKRVQGQIKFNDRGETARVRFVEDTNTGFLDHGEWLINEGGIYPLVKKKTPYVIKNGEVW